MNLSKFKKIGKYLAGIVAAGALLSLAIFPTLGLHADGPRFNFLQDDEEMFTGYNVANTSDDGWYDPFTVNAGDTFVGRIYYHNGVPDTVAEDTRVKVNLPEILEKDSAKLIASISADNADTVYNTVINGHINGPTGLNLNLDQDVKLDYVPGTVRWFPDAEQTNAAQAPLLFGQDGDELFSAGGLKIGDINGCWDYAGWVTFAVKTSPIPASTLDIDKTVRNVTAGTDYREVVDAAQDDIVRFKIDISADGYRPVEDVIAYDILPDALSPILNSGLISINGSAPAPLSVADYLSPNGVNIGDLDPGDVAEITFDAKAPDQILTAFEVINKAIAESCDIHVEDIARVRFIPGCVNILISKEAFNITQNIDATLVPANPGDEIVYTLHTANAGTLDQPVTVTDGISDILEYADVLTVSDGGTVVNNPAPATEFDNQVVTYPTVPLIHGTEVIRTFVVKVKNPLPCLPEVGSHYNYKMENIYGNLVIILINKPVIPPSMSITKNVRNVTANEQNFVKSDSAYAGDTLEYMISVQNTGQVAVSSVKIFDTLPNNVSLVPNSSILGMNNGEVSVPEKITDGIIITNFPIGGQAYVKFRVTVNAGVAANEDLHNVGYIQFCDVTLSDYADTIVLQQIVPVEIPVLPRTGAADSIIISLISALFGSGTFALAMARAKK